VIARLLLLCMDLLKRLLMAERVAVMRVEEGLLRLWRRSQRDEGRRLKHGRGLSLRLQLLLLM